MTTESRAPLLLPQNRKLRHFEGIWLRNLSFARPKGRTTDDVALNTSTSKAGALHDGPKLHHAHSTESLRPKARRRASTLAQDSPFSEQKKLMAMYDSWVADAFFSLHLEDEEEPIYVSEKQERKTNFNFLPFDLRHHDSAITRSSTVSIKIWVKRPVGTKQWTLHQEEHVDLRSLNFLGTLLNQHHPPNGLIFNLSDGYYSLDLPGKQSKPKDMPPLLTASYNALMKLATLENSIQDALQTQEQVMKQINEILEKRPKNEAPMAEQKAELSQRYLVQQRRTVKTAQTRREELQESIKARREAIKAGREAQDKAAKDVGNARETLDRSQTSLSATQESIRGQRRRICCDLADVFPITPTPGGQPLSFQICGLPLPNTSYDAATSKPGDEDALSAALGHVALLVQHLECYLSVPLPYPIYPLGSRSTIRDDISLLTDMPKNAVSRSASNMSAAPSEGGLNPAREFPLFLPRGGSTAGRFRFDYAWFLLNKDVEVLCASQALRVVDIRHTLPNIKYLLYVCSAGTEEVPQRKRGGVRGLWVGRFKGRIPTIEAEADGDGDVGSRRGSADSDAIARQREELQKAAAQAAGMEGMLAFDESDMKVTLRTKGFRGNAGK